MKISEREGFRYVAAGVWVNHQERLLLLAPSECRPGRGIEIMPEDRVKQLVEGMYRATFGDPLAVAIEVEEVYGLGPVGVDRGK